MKRKSSCHQCHQTEKQMTKQMTKNFITTNLLPSNIISNDRYRIRVNGWFLTENEWGGTTFGGLPVNISRYKIYMTTH